MDSLYHQQALDESRQLLSVLTYEALRGFPRVMSELANFVVDPRSDGLTGVVPLGQFLAQEHQPLSPLEGLVVGSFGIIGHVPPILPPLLVQTGGSGSGVAPAGKNSRSAGPGGLRDGEQLHFHDREFCVPVAHPEVVALPYPGMPWKLSETPGE